MEIGREERKRAFVFKDVAVQLVNVLKDELPREHSPKDLSLMPTSLPICLTSHLFSHAPLISHRASSIYHLFCSPPFSHLSCLSLVRLLFCLYICGSMNRGIYMCI